MEFVGCRRPSGGDHAKVVVIIMTTEQKPFNFYDHLFRKKPNAEAEDVYNLIHFQKRFKIVR